MRNGRLRHFKILMSILPCVLVAGFTFLALPFGQSARAERVRTLYASNISVEPVFLTMGRSTILRFDEKPKTVVIGNQNYFSVAYIGSDLSIQPLGVTTTNIFVYTESQTFSLILKVGPISAYDDLVNIKWKPGYMSVSSNKKKQAPYSGEVLLTDTIEIPGVISIKFERLVQTIAGVSIIELTAQNLTNQTMKASEMELIVLQGGKPSPSTAPLFKFGNALEPNASAEMRVLTRLSGSDQLSFSLRVHDKTGASEKPKPERRKSRKRK